MLKQQIQEDLKIAMREKDDIKVGALRMLLAGFVNKEKEKGEPINEEQAQNVLLVEAKKRKEAAEAFENGGRREMAEKERKELEILQTYLPEQIPEEEVRNLVRVAIQKIGACKPQDMGKVMAELMPQLKGKADGVLVSAIVKEFLS